MKISSAILLALVFGVPAAAARESNNYSITTEGFDCGGGSASAVNYNQTASTGGIVGLMATTAPAIMLKSGFTGQVFEIMSLAIMANPATIDECAESQATASAVLDDETLLQQALVAWEVVYGPVTVSSAGLITAAAVYEASSAQISARTGDLSAEMDLSITNSLSDNFGTYAGDAINDQWQVRYFGINNPEAAPLQDPDGDGQDNCFEWTAGLVPTDGQSRFNLGISLVPAHPGSIELRLSPCPAGRAYQVLTSTSLAQGTWLPLPNGTLQGNNGSLVISDTNAAGTRKFYRVEISLP